MDERIDGCVGLLAAIAVTVGACSESPALLRAMEARQRVANLAVQFHRASEATNRAVMADTDEASKAFAGEARAELLQAQAELDAVTPLIRSLSYQPETSFLEAFGVDLARYRELDERILSLAVENTNLKAQRLAFGAASVQADAVVASLATVAAASPSDWRLQARIGDVAAALRELQSLQAPHIAAAEESVMAGLETRMGEAEARARRGLATLGKISARSARSEIDTAADTFEAFMATHREMLDLSHRNTNVRSLALVLSEKGALTETCDQTLQRLQQALDTRASYGSR